MRKIIFILLLLVIPAFASDIEECRNFTTESDCKQNESNNCTWVSGEERCISKRKFNRKYNRRDHHPNRHNGEFRKGRRHRDRN